MTDKATQNPTPPGGEKTRSRKPAMVAITVVLVAAVVVAAVLNRDRLTVHSDVSTPEGDAAAATPNASPDIVALTVGEERIQPFTIAALACEATDPDGDQLTYTWSTTAGELFGEGPQVEWGSPATEGLYRVSAIVDDGRGGTAEQSLSLRVRANLPPEVVSLQSEVDWVAAGESLFVSCVATDPDGDDVSFAWTATGGALYGQGKSVVWLAPEGEGVHWITVVARDAYGGETEKKLSVSVTSGEPPEILELVVVGVNTDLLVRRGEDWHVYRGRDYTVTCVLAEETDGLTYAWTLEGFHMAGDGPSTTYTAPSGKATHTVAVTVTDQAGNASSAGIVIHTETCTCSF